MKTLIFTLLAGATLATGSIIEEGGGIVFGTDHTFSLKAPKGWMLDTGDKWGNFEAVAYFVEEKTINLIVFNSREEKLFTDSLPAFEELVKSYLFIGGKVDVQKPAEPAKPEKKAAK